MGLCYGSRLHAEELSDEIAPPFLALPSFTFRWQHRPGGAAPGGARGVLCAAASGSQASFGINHMRTRKFMCLGRCAELPGTDVDAIFHLALGPPGVAGCTLILADYAEDARHPPTDEGFALRWVEASSIPGRGFPYFACSPEGFSGPLAPARFRFSLRPALS